MGLFDSRHGEPLANVTFVAFDTETTGLWAAVNRIVEIGAISFTFGSEITREFQTLIDPARPIPESVHAIHGISDAMVAGQPQAREALTKFFIFCGTAPILIAHNAPFDLGFVRWELLRNDMSVPNWPVVDSVELARKLSPGLPSYSLLSLAQHFQLADTQAHRGLSDALLVSQLVCLLVKRSENIATLGDLFRLISVENLDLPPHRVSPIPGKYRDIWTAIESGELLKVVYRASSGEPTERVIHPRWVHELRGALYVTAFCELVGEERTFKLDRIQEYQRLKLPAVE